MSYGRVKILLSGLALIPLLLAKPLSAHCRPGPCCSELNARGFVVDVDYGETIDGVVALSPFDTKDNDISSSYFSEDEAKYGVASQDRNRVVRTTIRLITFGHRVTTSRAWNEIMNMGYRPANLYEIIALGTRYAACTPHIGEPVVALGSQLYTDYVFKGTRASMPVLSKGLWERSLELQEHPLWWGPVWRFAVVSTR